MRVRALNVTDAAHRASSSFLPHPIHPHVSSFLSSCLTYLTLPTPRGYSHPPPLPNRTPSFSLFASSLAHIAQTAGLERAAVLFASAPPPPSSPLLVLHWLLRLYPGGRLFSPLCCNDEALGSGFFSLNSLWKRAFSIFLPPLLR